MDPLRYPAGVFQLYLKQRLGGTACTGKKATYRVEFRSIELYMKLGIQFYQVFFWGRYSLACISSLLVVPNWAELKVRFGIVAQAVSGS